MDSDDWLSEDFSRFLDCLEACEKQGGADLIITNYIYDHAGKENNSPIRFDNALPAGRIFSWEETKNFRTNQVLMIHACTYRTELLKNRGLQLPKHIFYEDNLFIYGNLPDAKRLYYYDSDLYHYFIGRSDQSVQENVLLSRYRHQLEATKLCFTALHLDSIDEPQKLKYMKHEMFILFSIAIVAARLNGNETVEQAEKDLVEMWEKCREFDAKWADYFRYKSALRFLGVKGKAGRKMVRAIYRVAHAVVNFN